MLNAASRLSRNSDLALPLKPKIDRIGDAALLRVREQARLQVQGRQEGRLIYELLPHDELGKGLSALPLPSPADIFLDLESNPWVLDQGLEYLIGILTLSQGKQRAPKYEGLWSFTHAEEKTAFERFMQFVMARWRKHPEMHIYHYAPYEPTAIKRLAGRHGTCISEVDELLRAGVFVDLYRVVRQGLRASVESYSIKRLEPLYGFNRSVPLKEANCALQGFETALALGGSREEIQGLLDWIQGYNCDDCESAWRLRDWLEERRKDLERTTGQEIARPELGSGEPSETLSVELGRVAELVNRFVSSLPADEASGVKTIVLYGCSPNCWTGIAGRKSRPGGNTSGSANSRTKSYKRTRAHSVDLPMSERWNGSKGQ